MNNRHSGILLHITSIPSRYGIGDMGSYAYAFIDFLASSGQRFWQILPINPTDGINGNSPYSCSSAFGGNPLLISPQMMVIEGFLDASDLNIPASFSDGKVDYYSVGLFKEKIFNSAFKRFQKITDHSDFDQFVQEEHHWLEDFALFNVIKSNYGGRGWNDWPSPLSGRRGCRGSRNRHWLLF